MKTSTTFAAAMLALTLVAGCQHAPKGNTTPEATAEVSSDYFEFEHDGRIYVFASEESLESFKKTHHMPYTFTAIGAGPDGKTVVFEAPKDDPEVQKKLQSAFNERHGT